MLSITPHVTVLASKLWLTFSSPVTDAEAASENETPVDDSQKSEQSIWSAKEIAEKMTDRIHKTPSMTQKVEGKNLYSQEFKLQVKFLYISYFCFKKLPLEDVITGRLAVAKELLSSGTFKVLCDLYAEELQFKDTTEEDEEVIKNHAVMLRLGMCTVSNYMDSCDELTFAATEHPTLLPVVVKQVEAWSTRHLAKKLSVGGTVPAPTK